MTKSITCFIFLIGTLISSVAEGQSPERLDRGLEKIRAKYDLPALAAAIVTPDRITAIGAVGERAKGSQVAVTIHDQWHIGSCTKAMTAMLLARIIEQTKLTWDTTLEEAFGAAQVHPQLRSITVRQLVGHRSGLAANVDYTTDTRQPIGVQRAELVRRILSQPPVHRPGSTHLYSNTGYIVAGHIAELAGQASWEELMTTGVWQPLEMNQSGFGAPPTSRNLTQPIGHNADGTHAAGVDNPPVLGPAGTAHCTLSDWARFIADLMKGRQGNSSLLPKKKYGALHQPLPGQSYALGWGVSHNGTILEHAGSNNHWYCLASVNLPKNYAILITTNIADQNAKTAVAELKHELIKYQQTKTAAP